METLYEVLGGEAVIRRLVDAFYDAMESDPAAVEIRAMHPTNLSSSRDKLFWFLSGWSGGPQLYVERFGHPRLRMRHARFPIGDAEAAAWMTCMHHALNEIIDDVELRGKLADSFTGIAAHMRNQ